MKHILSLLLPITLLGSSNLSAANLRQTQNFNREWKFQLGDYPGAGSASYDDAKWESVGLPHSFSMPYFGSPHFYTGYGWYRKHFQAPQSWAGHRVFVEFEGVFQDGEVFVNGQPVGRHRGGYTGFSLDITNALKLGAENVLAVRVNNLWNARLAPRAGEHTFSGGIYRDMHLVVTDPLHVAWYGTFVTTPQVSKASATVNVKTEVVNDSADAQSATVKNDVLDSNGRTVAEMQSTLSVPAGKTLVFDQTSSPIANPKLWEPDQPNLYTVKTIVIEGKKPVDDFVSPFGFRWFKWTADKGLFLNGQHLYLYGANVHQDHAGWGDAVTNAGFERDVKLVKDAGFNFIRGSHYPHDPAFVDACDNLGVALWSENSFWGIGGFKPDGYWNSSAYPPRAEDQPEFEASVKQELSEMIRIYRNHPSILVWSMCNEPFFTEKSVFPKMRAFLQDLVSLSHQLDPTRPAAIGGAQRPLDKNRIDKIGDIAGYNGDGASQPAFQNPGVANMVSEYGSVTSVRPGEYKPGWDQLAKDNGKPVYPWRSGQSVWCMFDHGSIAGTNLGRMGIVDYFRIPKRAWYWYRNEYRHIPPPVWPVAGTPAKLRLEADKTILSSVDGTDDTRLLVTVLDHDGKPLSNSVPVTLDLVSGPGEFPTGPSIQFDPKSDIAILDGQAAIEFRSYYAGKSVIRATSPGLASAEITIQSQGEPQWIQGVTPAVRPRPYKRYTQAPSSNGHSNTDNINLAADRPTKASSSASGSPSGNVTDGNIGTLWTAARGDTKPWIQVDLENTYSLNRVQLTFPAPGAYRYTISTSSNGSDWKAIVDQSQNGTSNDAQRTATGDFGKGIRFVRVSFTGWPEGKSAALSEIAVGGHSE